MSAGSQSLCESPAELAAAVREQDTKSNVLHEARIKAFDEMTQAITAHRLASEACDRATTERGELYHRLQQAIRIEANRAISGG